MKTGKLIKEVVTRVEYNFIVVRPDNLYALARFIGTPREAYELRLAEYEGVVELIAFPPRCGSENMLLEVGDTLYFDSDGNLCKFDQHNPNQFKVFPTEEEDPEGYEKRWLIAQRELERLDKEYRKLRFGTNPELDLPPANTNVIIQLRENGFWYEAWYSYMQKSWVLKHSQQRLTTDKVVRWWFHHQHEENEYD